MPQYQHRMRDITSLNSSSPTTMNTRWLIFLVRKFSLIHDGHKCSHEHQCSSYRYSSPTPVHSCIGSSARQTRYGPRHFRFAWRASRRSMTTTPSLWRMGGGWRPWRLSWLIAWLFGWQLIASLAWVLKTLLHCVLTVLSACNISFIDLLMFPFDAFWGGVRQELMQRLHAALHGTLGSYFRNALYEGSTDAVACLPVSRA
jgi:hypothetical protein